jgi:hypothetical protein
MLKRLLGCAVRSRKRHSIDREIALRVLAINLMILWRLLRCFQQSIPDPFAPAFSSPVPSPYALRPAA